MEISPLTVRRHIAAGRLRALRAGRRVRVPRESVDRFLTPVVQSSAELERRALFEPPTPEELARRHEVVERILAAQRALPWRPGPTAVELIRRAREEEGPNYDPGEP